MENIFQEVRLNNFTRIKTCVSEGIQTMGHSLKQVGLNSMGTNPKEIDLSFIFHFCPISKPFEYTLNCSIGPKYVVAKRKEFAKKRNTQNLNFMEENYSHFYSWGLQRSVIKKGSFSGVLPCLLCSITFFLLPLLGDDTFMSVELLTGCVWHGSVRHGPLLNLFGNLFWTAKISLLGFLI